MSTTTQPNDKPKRRKAAPIDIDAALAKLILLRRERGLPRVVRFDAGNGEFGSYAGIYVHVATGRDVTAWAHALGIAEHRQGSFSGHDGCRYYDASSDDWNGWSIRVVSEAPDSAMAPSALDADTVAGLEDIAGPAEAVSA